MPKYNRLKQITEHQITQMVKPMGKENWYLESMDYGYYMYLRLIIGFSPIPGINEDGEGDGNCHLELIQD